MNAMNNNGISPVFHQGDEVVLVHGSYQGTPGIFFRLKADPGLGRCYRAQWIDPHPSGRVAGTFEAKWRKASRSGEMTSDICVWEDEGGAPMAPLDPPWPSLTGTESQVEWAERIRVTREG